jgi:Protein of unknown function (DUF2997)
MQQPTIKITLKLGEAMSVEVSGVRGSGCKALTQPLQQLGQVEQFTEKPEYYSQTVTANQTVTQSL